MSDDNIRELFLSLIQSQREKKDCLSTNAFCQKTGISPHSANTLLSPTAHLCVRFLEKSEIDKLMLRNMTETFARAVFRALDFIEEKETEAFFKLASTKEDLAEKIIFSYWPPEHKKEISGVQSIVRLGINKALASLAPHPTEIKPLPSENNPVQDTNNRMLGLLERAIEEFNKNNDLSNLVPAIDARTRLLRFMAAEKRAAAVSDPKQSS